MQKTPVLVTQPAILHARCFVSETVRYGLSEWKFSFYEGWEGYLRWLFNCINRHLDPEGLAFSLEEVVEWHLPEIDDPMLKSFLNPPLIPQEILEKEPHAHRKLYLLWLLEQSKAIQDKKEFVRVGFVSGLFEDIGGANKDGRYILTTLGKSHIRNYVTLFHEIGHALGLDENRENPQSVMYEGAWTKTFDEKAEFCLDELDLTSLRRNIPLIKERNRTLTI